MFSGCAHSSIPALLMKRHRWQLSLQRVGSMAQNHPAPLATTPTSCPTVSRENWRGVFVLEWLALRHPKINPTNWRQRAWRHDTRGKGECFNVGFLSALADADLYDELVPSSSRAVRHENARRVFVLAWLPRRHKKTFRRICAGAPCDMTREK